jgi:hypothetical protein
VNDAVAIHGYRGALVLARRPQSVHTFDHGLRRWSVHYTLAQNSRGAPYAVIRRSRQ